MFSKKLSPRMQSQYAYARDMHTIIKAVAKCHRYLFGHKFLIKTDHQSLKKWPNNSNTRAASMLPKPLGFNFIIECIRGKDNQATDALSYQTITWRTLWSLAWLSNNHSWSQTLVKHEGLWFWKGRLLISVNSNIKQMLLKELYK